MISNTKKSLSCMQFAASVLFVMVSSTGFAQDIDPQADTVKWQYEKIDNINTDKTLTSGGYLVSYGSQRLIWNQDGIDKAYVFDIISVQGEWHDTSRNGELLYQAVCDGIEGTVRIFKSGSKRGIEMNFVKPGKETPHVVLQINSHQKI